MRSMKHFKMQHKNVSKEDQTYLGIIGEASQSE